MKLIKKLGLRSIGNQGRNASFGVFECPSCHKLYERNIPLTKQTNKENCKSCNSSTHKMTGTDIYRVWDHMIQRCKNKKVFAYHRYGGRGISVCDDGLKFENFYSDMGDVPSKEMKIDRRDNDGNYEPSNCRWITHVENMRNSSASILNEEDVSAIKTMLLYKKFTQEYIANFFGVNRRTISGIKTGKSWIDVSPLPV